MEKAIPKNNLQLQLIKKKEYSPTGRSLNPSFASVFSPLMLTNRVTMSLDVDSILVQVLLSS